MENPAPRTDLQRTLVDIQLQRNFRQLTSEFDRLGRFQLDQELLTALDRHPDPRFTILDQGCGTGLGLRQAVGWLQRHTRKEVGGVGVDLNPILETPPGLFEEGPDDSVELIQAPAEKMPLPDASIDFGFSYATLIYIPDALSALTEAHRVLKPGGTMVWEGQADWITARPPLAEVLANTPGGSDFTPHPQGLLVLRKPENSAFGGFPYELDGIVWPQDIDEMWKAWKGPNKQTDHFCFGCIAPELPAFAGTLGLHDQRRAYYRSGIYKRMN